MCYVFGKRPVNAAALLIILSLVVLRAGVVSAQVTLEMWVSASADEATQREAIARFEREHPGIKVNLVRMPFGEIRSQLMVTAAAGVAPDVVEHIEASAWGYLGIAEPLDAFIARDDYDMSAYHPLALGPERYWNGRIWGLPRNLELDVILYNREMFQASGLANEPADWNEFEQYVRALTRYGPDGAVTVHGFSPQSIEVFLAGNGAPDLLEPNSQSAVRTNFNHPKVVEAGEFLTGMYRSGVALPYSSWSASQLQTGSVAMWGGRVFWVQDAFRNPELGIDLDFFLAPPKVAGDLVPIVGDAGGAILMTRQSRKKDAAWELIKYWGSRETLSEVWGTGTYGMLSPYKDAHDPQVNSLAHVYLGDPIIERLIFLSQVAVARPHSFQIFHVLREDLSAVWNEAWTRVRQGEVDVQTALDEAARQGDILLAQLHQGD